MKKPRLSLNPPPPLRSNHCEHVGALCLASALCVDVVKGNDRDGTGVVRTQLGKPSIPLCVVVSKHFFLQEKKQIYMYTKTSKQGCA